MCLGTPGRIVRFTDEARHTALVDFAGVEKVVNTGMVADEVDPPGPGDWVLVHLGIALHRVDPDEAADTQAFFDDLLTEFDAIAAERDARGH